MWTTKDGRILRDEVFFYEKIKYSNNVYNCPWKTLILIFNGYAIRDMNIFKRESCKKKSFFYPAMIYVILFCALK